MEENIYQQNQERKVTLLEALGNKITPKQLNDAVDRAQEAYETLIEKRGATNYIRKDEWQRVLD